MRKRLKILRVEKNLTQEEMAVRLNCSRQTYAAIENGERDGRRKFWLALQERFCIPDSELWSFMKNEE